MTEELTDVGIFNQLQAMSNGIPYRVASDVMRRLAERIAQQHLPASNTNVQEWAKHLVNDIADAND